MSDLDPIMQQPRKFSRHTLLLIVFLVVLGSLAGCGKRGGQVYAPDSVDDDKFPQTYPDPKTDPKP